MPGTCLDLACGAAGSMPKAACYLPGQFNQAHSVAVDSCVWQLGWSKSAMGHKRGRYPRLPGSRCVNDDVGRIVVARDSRTNILVPQSINWPRPLGMLALGVVTPAAAQFAVELPDRHLPQQHRHRRYLPLPRPPVFTAKSNIGVG
jgi:hypothetical protein